MSRGWARRRPRREIIRREAVIAKKRCESVDEYLAAQPPAARKVLRLVRSTLRKALPECGEVISYQIPAYRSSAGIVLFFAGWKEHYSLYPAIGGLAEKFRKELAVI